MKCSVLILLACLVFVVAHNEEIENMYVGLATVFSIKEKEVETCILKYGVTPDDLQKFSHVVFRDHENDQPERLRKATCALTCCAQTQGTMNGAKINLPEIRKLINQEDSMPVEAKEVYVKAVNNCGEHVKDITDACETAISFVRCIVETTRHYRWE